VEFRRDLWLEKTRFAELSCGFVTARCYASAVLAMALCPSVRPSQVDVLLKRQNVAAAAAAAEVRRVRR